MMDELLRNVEKQATCLDEVDVSIQKTHQHEKQTRTWMKFVSYKYPIYFMIT